MQPDLIRLVRTCDPEYRWMYIQMLAEERSDRAVRELYNISERGVRQYGKDPSWRNLWANNDKHYSREDQRDAHEAMVAMIARRQRRRRKQLEYRVLQERHVRYLPMPGDYRER